MKYTGRENFEELLAFATASPGSYTEYRYSKELHDFLLTKTKTFTFDKKTNTREYWLDRDNEWTEWRIILK